MTQGRIVLFGRDGQVATEVRRRGGAEIDVIDRGQADLARPGAAAAALDARLAVARPQAVVLAAAYTAVDAAENAKGEAHAINAAAPAEIAQLCAASGVPLVHVSTDYVFDGRPGRPWQEDDPTDPLSVYGATKRAGEVAVAASMEGAGVPYAILRTSWVFSAHGRNFVKTMLRLGAERDALSIVDDQVGGPTPAEAIADAALALLPRLASGESPGLVHFAGTPDVSWCGFAAAIFAAAGLDVALTPIATAAYPTPARRPLNSRLDCTKIEALGIARPDWRPALARTIAALG